MRERKKKKTKKEKKKKKRSNSWFTREGRKCRMITMMTMMMTARKLWITQRRKWTIRSARKDKVASA